MSSSSVAGPAGTPPPSTARPPACRSGMIEEARVGGTCLHRGCIPAKELLQTAEVLRTVAGAKEFGVEAGQPVLDLSVSQQRKQQVIDRLTKGLESVLKGRKVTVFNGHAARWSTPPPARCGSIRRHRDHRHQGAGPGHRVEPRSLPGFDFDGERILSLRPRAQHQPRSRPGWRSSAAGAIGCEFASFLGDVGSDVTVLEALPQILTGVDKDAADVVVKAFKKRGIKVLTGVKVNGASATGRNGDGVVVRYDAGKGDEELAVDLVVVSVGRRPRSEDIGLEGSGVEVDERGFVTVDGLMRTAVPGVYAVGDLVATPQLAHVGFAEAIVAIKAILGEPVVPIDYGKVPWGIYCHPEVAFCGLTEAQAKEKGYDIAHLDPPVHGQRPGADHRRVRRDREGRGREGRRRSSACTSPGRGPPSCWPRATWPSTGRRCPKRWPPSCIPTRRCPRCSARPPSPSPVAACTAEARRRRSVQWTSPCPSWARRSPRARSPGG